MIKGPSWPQISYIYTEVTTKEQQGNEDINVFIWFYLNETNTMRQAVRQAGRETEAERQWEEQLHTPVHFTFI